MDYSCYRRALDSTSEIPRLLEKHMLVNFDPPSLTSVEEGTENEFLVFLAERFSC